MSAGIAFLARYRPSRADRRSEPGIHNHELGIGLMDSGFALTCAAE